ncbi:Eco29kI family restriction endonuclease [Kitasatospora sp. NBC_01300]|uniref:Eco29kI family restriction endonuclease n=1 Tax=Kitasatospora sp. NBC_01300 TaxID=2903574 RepID=UPI00352E5FD3|nr:Eco29kI family restriction endonuclease [Kitasatospora sp. NBC_01300]
MGDQSGRQQLSDTLGRLLDQSGLTKKELAIRGNLSRTTVSAAFSPESPPPSDRTIETIADTLDADPAPLYNLLAIARNEEAQQPRLEKAVAHRRLVQPTWEVARPSADPRLRELSFDPLRPENLVRSVVDRFRSAMPYDIEDASFWARDAGIYGIYYIGAHRLYMPIAGSGFPLYVGGVQSSPTSSRAQLPRPTVSHRLEEHRRTLFQSRDLDPADFMVQVLFIDDLFIPPVVDALTTEFKPLWNTTLDGFALRNPGRLRRIPRPKWHELHAGPDSWAAGLEPKRSPTELEEEVRQHFAAWLR